jgi:nitrite reductase (NO-forming)
MKKNLLVAAIAILFLSSCGGSNTENASTAPAASAVVSGESVYKKTCIACHQPTGEGVPGAFPPIAKSDYLVNKEAVIRQVLKGSSGDIVVNGKTFNNVMPPQALSDNEIAAVLTYVYGNFGNGGGTVTPDEVKAVRAKL